MSICVFHLFLLFLVPKCSIMHLQQSVTDGQASLLYPLRRSTKDNKSSEVFHVSRLAIRSEDGFGNTRKDIYSPRVSIRVTTDIP